MTSSYWGPTGVNAHERDDEDDDIDDILYRGYGNEEGENDDEDDEQEYDETDEADLEQRDDNLHLNIPYNRGEDPDDNDMCRGYGTHTNLDYDNAAGFEAHLQGNAAGGQHTRRSEGADAADGVEPVASMPAEFYCDVENFLSKGPPALGEVVGKKKKKKKKGGGGNQQTADGDKKVTKKGEKGSSSDAFLPQIGGAKSAHAEKPPPLPPAAARQKVAKKYTAAGDGAAAVAAAAAMGVPSKQIDNDLLKEAFAYTDKLLKEALIEEQTRQVAIDQQQNRRHGSMGSFTNGSAAAGVADLKKGKKISSQILQEQQEMDSRVHAKSAPADMEQASTRKKQQGAGLSAYKASATSAAGGGSMVKKLRSRTNQSRVAGGAQYAQSTTLNTALQQHEYLRNGGGSGGGGSGSGGGKKGAASKFSVEEVGEKDTRRNVVNYDELIANFQNGTTLQALQKELEMSKKSMARSEQFLRDLSKEYFS